MDYSCMLDVDSLDAFDVSDSTNIEHDVGMTWDYLVMD